MNAAQIQQHEKVSYARGQIVALARRIVGRRDCGLPVNTLFDELSLMLGIEARELHEFLTLASEVEAVNH